MLRFFIPIFALIISSLGSAPAIAGKKDDAWAQCLWEAVPQSAANWIKLPAGERRIGLGKPGPEFLLGIRLQAACHGKLTIEGKKGPPSFDSKKVRESLTRIRPAEVGLDKLDPKSFQCTRFFLNDTDMKNPAEYSWGFGDFESGVIFSRVQFLFAATGGGSVGLPETGGLRKCQRIDENGMLLDA